MAGSIHYGITVCPRLNTHRFHRRRSHGWVWLALVITASIIVWGVFQSLGDLARTIAFIS